MTKSRCFILAAFLLGLGCNGSLLLPASAQDQKVIVTVNDQPITSFDIQQRINLWKLLGDGKSKGDGARKRALNELIDDIANIEEAKKFKADATEKEIDERLQGFAKGLKTDWKGLPGKLRAQGISVAGMRQYAAAQIAFARLVRGKFKEDFSIPDAQINKRLAQLKAEIDGNINAQIRKIESDPRRRPITVYELMEISFPIVAPEGGITPELFQSRAIESSQFLSRFKGCGSARSAASGIFNVKISKKFDADATRMPKPMKQALDNAGTGRAVGPMRGKDGLQVLAFCGIRKIVPPKIQRPKDIAYPTADQVRGLLQREKEDAVRTKYAGQLRKGLMIEFRDPSYGQ